MAKYSDELKGVVRALYLRRYTPKEIASELNLPNARIVYYWAEKYKWADLLSFESTEEAIERRYQLLAGRDNKTDLDLKEMDLLIAHATKLRAQSNKHKEKLASSQGERQAAARGESEDEPRSKRKYKKNDISSLTQDDFDTWADDRLALAQLINLNGQHGGIIHARKNMVTADYQGGGLTFDDLEAAVFDYLTFGDIAVAKVRNGWGDVIGLQPLPGLYLRRRKEKENAETVPGDYVVLQEGEPLAFPPEDIIFIKMYDPQQHIYGLPDYIGGVHSALLNSEAVIFRRRYYHNGAHTGGILYTRDPSMTDEMEEEIEQQLRDSKGIGNFSISSVPDFVAGKSVRVVCILVSSRQKNPRPPQGWPKIQAVN